jgi:hypothetical protein
VPRPSHLLVANFERARASEVLIFSFRHPTRAEPWDNATSDQCGRE